MRGGCRLRALPAHIAGDHRGRHAVGGLCVALAACAVVQRLHAEAGDRLRMSSALKPYRCSIPRDAQDAKAPKPVM